VRILGAGGPVWADVAPASGMSASTLLLMPWWTAITGAIGTHVWFGGWSFLSVRSWIYAAFFWTFVFVVLGSLRSKLSVVWGLYASFWAAMMYHAAVTFISVGTPSSTGSYLYAVISCEVVILCAGLRSWFPRTWRYAMVALIGMFLL